MSKLGDAKYRVLLLFARIINNSGRRFFWKPNVMSEMDTLDCIIKNRKSISRFGDGEFKWMLGIPQDSFQAESEDLRRELICAYRNDINNLLICLPDCFGNLSKYKTDAQGFWSMFMIKYRNKIKKMSMSNYEYGNLAVTRFYIDYNDSTHVAAIINKWKQVWNKRSIVIVEGELTRLGVGNDLFSTSKNIKRILAPAKNAYDKSEEILDYIGKNIDKDDLILLALGPTATILSSKLAQIGYQALDIGHIDVEYSWYLMGVREKAPVKFKYVNEASHLGGANVSDIDDPIIRQAYEKQIIRRFL